MQIPLDYYRILGLPVQATPEQLRHAHQDRTQQLPRQEYSEVAIAVRRQLLDDAYAVLSHSEHRQEYDRLLLPVDEVSVDTAATVPISQLLSALDSKPPSIEVTDDQLIGALLILLELGEYELVLDIGRPYLSTTSIKTLRCDKPKVVLSDILLTVALACLQMGREQWQQAQYELAASSLEIGQELLQRQGLFPDLLHEIQADLYKLRPYRILELVALPEDNRQERQRGIQLLCEMLDERSGIEGKGNDQSGLSIDYFLRFLQQLQDYLTVAEQLSLFEQEFQRPSAAAAYLQVYALLAQGFADKQPVLIRRAKRLLEQLSYQQNVHLELAVCSLLLGQTESAIEAIAASQEENAQRFIQLHSQGAPDLLPGLCLYTEQWLQSEVFPHFRDLAQKTVSLKDYFANLQVQAYLEELLQETKPELAISLTTSSAPPMLVTPTAPPSSSREMAVARLRQQQSATVEELQEPVLAGASGYTRRSTGVATTIDEPRQPEWITSDWSQNYQSGLGQMESSASSYYRDWDDVPPRGQDILPGNGNYPFPSVGTVAFAPDSSPRRKPITRPHRFAHRRSLRSGRLLLLFSLGGIAIAGALSVQLFRSITTVSQPESTPTAPLQGEQLEIGLADPPLPIPDASIAVPTAAPNAVLTPEVARKTVETWLATKAAALGTEHKIDQLAQILAEPALSRQKKRAEEAKQEGWYWQFQHQVASDSLALKKISLNVAHVDVRVTESAKLFEGDKINQNASYNSPLLVRYQLIRKDNQWRIQDMQVLK